MIASTNGHAHCGTCLLAPDVLLVADSVGLIWRVDLSDDGRTATARVWLKDPSMNPGPPVQTLVGCETETMHNHRVGVDREFARSVDIVLVPTTHYHLSAVPRPSTWAPAAVADHMLSRLTGVLALDYVDAIAHPFADHEDIIGDLRAIYEGMPPARLQETLGLAAEQDVALEVNGAALSSTKLLHYPAVYAEICRLAKSLGVRFIYEAPTEDIHEGEAENTSGGVATVADLRSIMPDLPADWAANMYQATTKLDAEQMLALITQIRPQAPRLADTFMQWIHDYEYEKIMELTASTEMMGERS